MFKRMKLSVKLIAGFIAVAAIAAVIGTVGFVSLRNARGHIVDVGTQRLPSIQNLLTISENLEKIKVAQRTLLNPDITAADRARQYEHVAKAREAYGQAVTAYEALSHSEEDQRLWTQFKQSLDEWRKENNTFFDLCRQVEQTDVLNPAALGMSIEKFVCDHYVLKDKVAALLQQQSAFEGGDDHTACNFGKWVAQFKTENHTIDSVINGMLDGHRQFHQMVKQIKESVKAGNTQEATAVYGRMQELLVATFKDFDKVRAEIGKAATLYQQATSQGFGGCANRQKEVQDTLEKLIVANKDAASQAVADATLAAARSGVVMLGTQVVGVALALVLGVFLSMSITKPINRIIAGLTEGAEQVAAASGQVSAASQSLAEGATEQAAGLQETSSSLEEMSSMTKQNSDNAQQANALASEAKKAAGTGAEAMNRMNAAIQEIQKSADETAKIIKVIDEIAFQTNLLALNAAANQEQAQGSDQVNTAVAQMDKVTQQNAANAEESASASEELSAQAESMKEIVSQLVTLVGGAAKKSNRSTSKPTLLHSDRVFHGIANGRSPKISARSGENRQAVAIPLTDDEKSLGI